MQVIETIASVLTVMGGWEAARYFISRKTNRRKEEAEAETLRTDIDNIKKT